MVWREYIWDFDWAEKSHGWAITQEGVWTQERGPRGGAPPGPSEAAYSDVPPHRQGCQYLA